MEAVLARYLPERSVSVEAQTLHGLEFAMRHLIRWVACQYPTIDSFAQLTREHVLEFARALDDAYGVHSKRPLATHTKISILTGVATFFRDVAYWGWDGVPTHPLLVNGDLPKRPKRVPRFILDDELARLMQARRSVQACRDSRRALDWGAARRDPASPAGLPGPVSGWHRTIAHPGRQNAYGAHGPDARRGGGGVSADDLTAFAGLLLSRHSQL